VPPGPRAAAELEKIFVHFSGGEDAAQATLALQGGALPSRKRQAAPLGLIFRRSAAILRALPIIWR